MRVKGGGRRREEARPGAERRRPRGLVEERRRTAGQRPAAKVVELSGGGVSNELGVRVWRLAAG